ncbi:proline-rich proteoglycan 2-like [Cinclus cinclus]|uniref:proline-rich proteoglycan 2-like n=1 Tax=Cinclus cinclus TaxID=127875 RepID=UPI002E145FD2
MSPPALWPSLRRPVRPLQLWEGGKPGHTPPSAASHPPARPNNGALHPAGPGGSARRARSPQPRGGITGSPQEGVRDAALPARPRPPRSERDPRTHRRRLRGHRDVRRIRRSGQRRFRSRQEAPGSARSALGDAPRGEEGEGWRVRVPLLAGGGRPARGRRRRFPRGPARPQRGPGTPVPLRAHGPLRAQLAPAPGGGSTAAPDRRLRARPAGRGAPRIRSSHPPCLPPLPRPRALGDSAVPGSRD